MSATTLEQAEARFPVDSRWQYFNPGRFGHNNIAKVSDYLCRVGSPDRISHVVLKFSNGHREHVVTVNQLKKHYNRYEK